VEKKERFAGDFDRRSLRHGSAFAAEFALQNVRSMIEARKKVLVSRMGNSWIFLEHSDAV
jgi:hypothetical protein